MGDITEMILDGTLCQRCGAMVYDKGDPKDASKEELSPGYPRTCQDCLDVEE